MSDSPSSGTPHQPERNHPAWIGGAILILIGFIFLVQNLTGFSLSNWWALFILIPAINAFGHAYNNYKNDGRLSGPVRRSLFGGLILTFVALVFLFNLNFGTLWPVLLILGGVVLLVNALLPE